MKSVKKTITTANLNTGTAQKVQISIDSNEEGLKEYPQKVVFVNNTGATIGLLYIQTDDEDTIKTNYNQFYDFIPLDTGRSTEIIPSYCKYIYIKLLTGTATDDLDFYLLGYIPLY